LERKPRACSRTHYSFVSEIPDPADVVAQLESAGLRRDATNEWLTAVAADWGPKTQTVIQVVVAFISQSPIPAWQRLFSNCVPRALGELEFAQFGIGSPSIVSLANGGWCQRAVAENSERTF
jgi:hypothetical protein